MREYDEHKLLDYLKRIAIALETLVKLEEGKKNEIPIQPEA